MDLSPLSRNTRFSRITAVASGAFAVAAGLAALFGWHARIPVLTQVLPHLVAMQYNTALCFVLCGASLALTSCGRTRPGQYLALLPAAFGLLSLAEYATGADLGIDQLFMRDYLAVQISNPGRMAWQTAVCFTLFGVQSWLGPREGGAWAKGCAGTVMLALGCAALAGYATGLFNQFIAGDATRMAVLTALGFSALGNGIMAELRAQGKRFAQGLPIFTALFFMNVTVSLWQSQRAEEHLHLRRMTAVKAEEMVATARAELDALTAHLCVTGESWELRSTMTEAQWRDDARSHMAALGVIRELGWVDPAAGTDWTQPPRTTGAPDGGGFHLPLPASASGGIAFSGAFRQPDGSFLTRIAIAFDGPPPRMFTATLDIGQFLQRNLEHHWRHYPFRIFEGGKPVFQSPNWGGGSPEFDENRDIPLPGGKVWSIHLSPKISEISHYRDLDIQPIAFGIMLAALASIAIFYAQRLQRKTVQLEFHMAHLEELVTLRSDALRENEMFLQAAVRGANVGIFDWRVGTDTVRYSDEWKALLGYADGEIGNGLEEWSSRLHPDDRERMLQSMDELVAAPRDWCEWNYRLRHRDGSYRWFMTRASMTAGPDGRAERMVGVIVDITDLKASEEMTRRYAERASALLELSRPGTGADEGAFLQFGLELAERLTGSSVSFVHFVNDDQETIELAAWSERTLQSYCTAAYEKHYPVSAAGIWADAFRRRVPVLCNDYAAAADARGLPEGHARLERFLCVPVLENEVVRMMAGVGNAPAPYTGLDEETLQLLANTMWHIVRQRRMEQSESESRERLGSTLDGLAAHIALLDGDGTILLVNTAWREFARANGVDPDRVSEGANYLHACAAATGLDRQSAAAFAAGIRDVLDARQDAFMLEYPCHSPDTPRWFIGRVTACAGRVRQAVVAHENITARKLAEIELQQAMTEANRFREALDHVSTYVYIKDTESRYVYANRQTLKLFGCTAAELPGSDDSRFFPAETVRRLREIDLRVFQGQKTAEEIHVPDPANGARIYWEIKTPIYAGPEGGPVWGLLGISTDITERKNIESRLLRDLRLRQAQARLYRPLVQPDISLRDISGIVVDESRELLGCAEGYAGTLGLDLALHAQASARMAEECAVDGSASHLVFPTDADGTYPGLWGHSLNTREPFYTNDPAGHPAARGLPADHARLASFLSVPVRLGERLVGQISLANKPGGFTSDDLEAMVQISEFYALAIQRIMTQHALQNEKALLEMILDGIHAGILVIHPATWRVEDANLNTLRLFGCAREELIGTAFDDLGWQTIEGGKVSASLALQASGPRSEFLLGRPDGSSVPVGTTLVRTRINSTEMILVIIFDISSQKELERQLLLAQKLESLGQLAAGIAHEINTPSQYVNDNLHFISDAFSQITGLMKKAAEHGLDEQCRMLWSEHNVDFLMQEIPLALSQSVEGIARISTIVTAMKRFSHPGSDQRDAININEALRTTALIGRNEWKYHAELVFDLDEDLPLVPGYANDLNQVFLNVLVNGSQAIEQVVAGTGGMGTLTISTRHRGDWVEIRFRDTGCGIPPEHLPRIFDPFFTTKPVGKGTGQGLAISYQIISKHGGRIEYASTHGQGTECVISLPLSSQGE
jgi:PAS domain S-box-containing protein